MAIYFDRANNPQTWTLTDSVVLVEQPAPAPATLGPGDGRVGMVGEFPWGPVDTLVQVNVPSDLKRLLGEAEDLEDWSGYQALEGKAWPAGGLYLVRAGASSGHVKASRTIAGSTPENIFSITAKYPGSAGNQITVKFVQVSSDVFSLYLEWNGVTREYLNLDRATTAFDGIDDAWVDLVWLDADASEALPSSDSDYVALSSGANGTISDADWTGSSSSLKGLYVLRGMPDGGIVVNAGYTSAAWLTALSAHTLAKGCAAVAQADDGDVFADNVTAADGFSDESVRLMLHRVTQSFVGVSKNVDLAPFYASVYAAIDPSESVAQARWAELYLRRVTGVVGDALLERGNWITGDAAGGIMMERLSSGLFKFHMDITSDTTAGKTSSVRKRMADYLGAELGRAHEPFLNTKPTPSVLRRQKAGVKTMLDAKVAAEQIEAYSNVLDAQDGSSTTWITKVKLFGEQRYIIVKLTAGETVVIEAA